MNDYPMNRYACAVALGLALLAGSVRAQEGVERKILQRHDLDLPGREALLVEVRLAAGGREGRHTHPGTVLAYVIEGELTLEMEGVPARTLVAGESVVIEPGRVHEGINRSSAPIRILAGFVVEKGKPLATPSP